MTSPFALDLLVDFQSTNSIPVESMMGWALDTQIRWTPVRFRVCEVPENEPVEKILAHTGE